MQRCYVTPPPPLPHSVEDRDALACACNAAMHARTHTAVFSRVEFHVKYVYRVVRVIILTSRDGVVRYFRVRIIY